jgi:hypothetical protein
MPEKQKECHCMKGKPMLLGVLLFLIGFLAYVGYDWKVILMIVGVLLFLKGIWLQLKKK